MKAERRGELSDKLVILTCVDKDTGMIGVVPLPSKDGSALQYAAKEVLSFLSYLGRTEAEIRGDNEPSMQNLVTRIVTARASVGLATRPSPTQPYEHQTNGPAEQSIQSVREIGATLLQQVKQSGYVLSNDSDVVGWAYVRASMVHNTFAVQAGTTAYERAFHVRYTGKLACFGETVYLALGSPHVRKGKPRFVKGLFLGKTLQNDMFICGTRWVSM